MPNPNLDRDRVAFLEEREDSGRRDVPAWPRANKALRLVEVPVEWLRFSTRNHRTTAEQKRAIAQAGRLDLFTRDPLGPDAQEAQYRILKAQEGFSDLKADLRKREQQEPAIVTAEGVLINGNRRSAAMRSLVEDDQYLAAKYVRCLVLPEDAEANELVDLEAELQVARDFKQDYSWINEAMLIEELYEREAKNWNRVATRVHRPVNDVRATYEKLQQVHQLVALSKGSRHYVDFDENESAFDELAKHVRSRHGREASSVRSTYFLGTLAGVQYRTLRHLRRPDASELVLRELQREANALLETAAESVALPTDEPEIDDLLGEVGEPRDQVQDVLMLLATKSPEQTIVLKDGAEVVASDVLDTVNRAICAAAEEAGESARESSVVREPGKRVDAAIASLSKALIALPRARSFDDWEEVAFAEKLDQLDELVKGLRESP